MKTSRRHLSPKQRQRLATRQSLMETMTSSYVDDKMGKMAYDAYMTQQGDITKPWDGLTGGEQQAWIAAARTIEYFVAGRPQDDAA